MNDSSLTPPSQSEDPSAESEVSESSLIQVRKEKRAQLQKSGINPYPETASQIENRSTTADIKSRFDGIKSGEESEQKINLCGRIMTRREMGKAAFAHLQDFHGQLQIYLRKDVLGDATYETFKKYFDIGDIVGAKGKIFRTKTGELTLKAEEISLLSKSLRPLPEKWHGLKDAETRARVRELDLISNPSSKKVFEIRSRVIQSLRKTLGNQGYMEVETPIMQAVPGGAVAKPFETYHKALGQKLYLRVAPELYLKRCLVGGLEKVFEIGRVFRNEGIDTLHNPEFTIMEAYESYGNMESMMALAETLIKECAKEISFNADNSGKINFEKPFARATIAELFRKYAGEEEAHCVLEQNWKKLAEKCGHSAESGLIYKVFDHIFSEKIQHHLAEPTFVTEFPSDFSPLAKCKNGSPNIAERYELYVAGEEIANAYSELNDPVEQKNRLENYRQSRTVRSEEDEREGMGLDESFITSLEYGMPPAGGLGIGVDRLVMLLAGKDSIRDVLLFPTLRNNP